MSFRMRARRLKRGQRNPGGGERIVMLKRCIVSFSLLLLFGGAAFGQSNEEKYQQKLQKEFMKKIEWTHSLEDAMKKSKETGKPIFGYFTRSYAP